MVTTSQLLEEAAAATGVSHDTIKAATDRIRPYIHRTPILSSKSLSAYLNTAPSTNGTATDTDDPAQEDTIFLFKAENLQKTGSFKLRGALNAVSTLCTAGDQPVVTHSSGNHGAAVAHAAGMHSRKAYVVMPTDAAGCKREAVEHYGGVVVGCEAGLGARREGAERVRDEVGGVVVDPFLDGGVMSGQGTLGVEIVEQVPDVGCVVVPIGGGGLIGGVCTAVKWMKPETVVIGAEPRGVCSAWWSLREGGLRGCDGWTVADGVRAGLGWRGWEVVRRLVDGVVVVEEDEIREGVKMVLGRLKVVVEPAAGVAVAAGRRIAGAGFGKVVVVLCGGNVELEMVQRRETDG